MASGQCGTRSWRCLGNHSSPISQWTLGGPHHGPPGADTNGQRLPVPRIACQRTDLDSLAGSYSVGPPRTETVGSVFGGSSIGPPSCTWKFQNLLWGTSNPGKPLQCGPLWGQPFFLPLPPQPSPPSLSGSGQPLHCLTEWPGQGHSTSLCLSFSPLESPRAWKNGRYN